MKVAPYARLELLPLLQDFPLASVALLELSAQRELRPAQPALRDISLATRQLAVRRVLPDPLIVQVEDQVVHFAKLEVIVAQLEILLAPRVQAEHLAPALVKQAALPAQLEHSPVQMQPLAQVVRLVLIV